MAEPGPANIYLHGAPGSPGEARLFDVAGADLFVPDRFALASGLGAAESIDQLARDLVSRFSDREMRLIGFSIGAFAALQLAHRLKGRIAQIDLISSAAPLEGGDFLPDMAGAVLFKLARDRPRLFRQMVAGQRLMAHFAPGLLFRALFSGAAGADRALAANPGFQAPVKAVLQSCFVTGAAGYAREIEAYVQPWASILPGIAAPVTLWHGSDDNWAPVAMAKYLECTLPNVVRLEIVEGASHYSTLRHAMMRTCISN